jgi:hypothetical protein
MGFSLSADWGQDTYWDIYGRYSGEWNGIKLAAVTGWSETNGCRGNQTGELPLGFLGTTCLNSPSPFGLNGINTGDVGYWQSGLYVEHVATGVWFLANYGREFLGDLPAGLVSLGHGAVVNASAFNSEPDHWYLKAGLRERWVSLGHTVPYAFYGQRNDMIGTDVVQEFGVTGTRQTEWGLGIVQEVDAAAMSFWLQYDHFHASVNCDGTNIGCFNTTGADQNAVDSLKDMSLVKAGALINF